VEWAGDFEGKLEGEIKAPPSVGVHVVGLTNVIATAQKLACWRLG
jgi:hypothetical protein